MNKSCRCGGAGRRVRGRSSRCWRRPMRPSGTTSATCSPGPAASARPPRRSGRRRCRRRTIRRKRRPTRSLRWSGRRRTGARCCRRRRSTRSSTSGRRRSRARRSAPCPRPAVPPGTGPACIPGGTRAWSGRRAGGERGGGAHGPGVHHPAAARRLASMRTLAGALAALLRGPGSTRAAPAIRRTLRAAGAHRREAAAFRLSSDTLACRAAARAASRPVPRTLAPGPSRVIGTSRDSAGDDGRTLPVRKWSG